MDKTLDLYNFHSHDQRKISVVASLLLRLSCARSRCHPFRPSVNANCAQSHISTVESILFFGQRFPYQLEPGFPCAISVKSTYPLFLNFDLLTLFDQSVNPMVDRSSGRIGRSDRCENAGIIIRHEGRRVGLCTCISEGGEATTCLLHAEITISGCHGSC